MTVRQEHLIEAIHTSGFQACIVVTGGGSELVYRLLSHPGASRFVLDIQIPYSKLALAHYLGESPSEACSEKTARLISQTAFHTALKLSKKTDKTMGMACTAALRTCRERRGEDRAFLCFRTCNREVARKFSMESADRREQEKHLSAWLLDNLARFVGYNGK